MEQQIQTQNGAKIGIAIIVLILIIGGIYIWNTKIDKEQINKITETMNNEKAQALDAYNGLENIEQEINNTTETDVLVGDVEGVN